MEESKQFRDFTSGLAARIRAEEKRRFWRLIAYMAILAITLLGLLGRMQYNDQQLRESLIKHCEMRNLVLEIDRERHREMIAHGDPSERTIWASTLARLPSAQDCNEYDS